MKNIPSLATVVLSLLAISLSAFAGDPPKPSEASKTEKKTTTTQETPKPAVDAKLVAAEKKLIALWNKHKSVTATMTMDGKMEQFGQPVVVKGNGAYEMQKGDDKEKIHFEVTANMTMGEGDSAMKMKTTVLIISDGEFAYTLAERMGQWQATKTKSEMVQIPPVGGEKAFAALREGNTLKLLPDAKLDGKDTYVVEASPTVKSPNMQMKNMILNYDKKSGILLKTVVNNNEGKPMQTITFSDIKLDQKIDPDRFVFKAPEGVTVIDQTQM